MYKKILILFLFCPVFWFTITHLNIAIDEWRKFPTYFYHGISTLFSIDKIRYSVELNNGNFLSRFFYNKVSYFIGVIFNSLSLASPSRMFIGQISIIFLPLWFLGIYKLIKMRKFWWIVNLFVASTIIYLTGQTSPYYLIFLVPFYLYVICASF